MQDKNVDLCILGPDWYLSGSSWGFIALFFSFHLIFVVVLLLELLNYLIPNFSCIGFA